MKLAYHKDTDSLYIDLSEKVSVESREISDGVELSGLRGEIRHRAGEHPHA